jgi:hypothetical protein
VVRRDVGASRTGSTVSIMSGPEPFCDDFVIRVARPGQEQAVLDLLAEAAAWLRGRGIRQWPARFPAHSVRTRIDAGEALPVERAHCPVATLAVAEDDTELWGSGAGAGLLHLQARGRTRRERCWSRLPGHRLGCRSCDRTGSAVRAIGHRQRQPRTTALLRASGFQTCRGSTTCAVAHEPL